MRSLTLVLAAALVALPLGAAAADATKADAVKEVVVKDLKKMPKFTKVTTPTEIKSADELAKAIEDEAALAAVKKDVNFDTQKVVLFAWQGSGGDKLATAADKDEVTFTHTPGLTLDLRSHVRVFVVPKDAKVKVVAK